MIALEQFRQGNYAAVVGSDYADDVGRESADFRVGALESQTR
jgi:hypothetical protein